MHVKLVSGTYFPLLGVQAQVGRTLTDADDTSEGDHPVVVVSHAFWKHTLASDPNVLDRKLKLGTTIFNIVGVAPPEFFGTKVGEAPDMWVPMSMTKSVPPGWDAYKNNFTQSLNLMGRLKPGVTMERGDLQRQPASAADHPRLLRCRPQQKEPRQAGSNACAAHSYGQRPLLAAARVL